MNNESKKFKVFMATVSWMLAIIFLIPIIWMIAVSLKKEGTPIFNIGTYFIPPYTFKNYIHIIMETPMMQWMLNSVIIAIISTLATLFIASLAAYALSKIDFRYKKFTYFLFLAGLMVPGEATIIPLYVIVNKLGLLDSYSGLIFPGLAAPFAIIILKSFFDSIPKDLLDSANIDGCGIFRSYWSIVLPLSKSAIAAIGIFTFIGSWNNFLWPFLCVTSVNHYTLPVGIPTFNSNYSRDYVLPMAVNTVASIPVIIAFLLFEKQIVKGIALTGIKG